MQLGNSLLDSRSVVVMVEQHEGASYALVWPGLLEKLTDTRIENMYVRSVLGR